ncbi:MAG: hypothetical protein GXO92_04890 [FCB group bacterium]|nr:hypothetical protein [FCB group bacterium]
MTNKVIPLLLWIAVLIGINGCTIDNPRKAELPSWKVTLEFPLMETTIGLSELLADSLVDVIPYNQSGDSIFVIRDTVAIERMEVGDQLELDPIENRFVQYASKVRFDSSRTSFAVVYDTVGIEDIRETIRTELGIIELDNITPDTTAPFTFRDIMPNSDQIDSILAANGGTADIMIDTTQLVPQTQNFTFESFRSADISSGFMNLTIINEMFIDLGAPIIVTIKDLQGDSLFSATWETEIPTGSAMTRTIDLSGQSLPGELMVVVRGASNGSRGEIITVNQDDPDSYFKIVLEPVGIQASRANAKIPSQTIHDSSSVQLTDSETKVEEAELRTGRLSLSIRNNMQITGQLEMKITSLRSSTGESYLLSIPMPVGTGDIQEDLTGWIMTMDLADQAVYYTYRIITDDTDPEFVQVSATDSVTIQMRIENISFRRISGIIESQQITKAGQININSDSQIRTATISGGGLFIAIDNRIGGQATVDINIPRLLIDGGSLTTTILVNPGLNETYLDLSGYDIAMPLDDQRITYTTVTTTQSGQLADYNLLDSIQVDLLLSELDFSVVTGLISQDAIIDENTIVLENETKVQDALIESGQMEIVITNHIGLVADVAFAVREFRKNGSQLRQQILIQNTSEPETTLVDLSGYRLQLPLQEQVINYSSTLTISSDEEVTLALEDSVEIDLTIANLRFSEITGIIEPVTVDIDTIEQTLGGLDGLGEGIDFKQVDLTIDFDTNIGVPVFLNLNLVAKNDAGETAVSSIENWNIRDSSLVVIPNAEKLINIIPNKIIASGSAVVGAPGVVGTVATDQYIEGKLMLNAPLELYLKPDARIELDPERVESDFPEELDQIIVYAKMNNQFEFGAQIEVLVASDSGYFHPGSLIIPDTLMVLEMLPKQTQLDSVVLGDREKGLLSDSSFIKPIISLLGNSDSEGNPISSRFFATDSLQVLLYGSGRVLVDLDE